MFWVVVFPDDEEFPKKMQKHKKNIKHVEANESDLRSYSTT